MSPEQWARVKELFHAALAREARERHAFVAEASAEDPLVRAEVERLLDADLASSDFLESPAVDALLTGHVIGRYEIGRLLGAGGMGRVYAARDRELGREVAVKIASVENDEAQARLRREAQHASRLSHPHICHIYEVGRAEGRVFVVMELVPGRPLADLIREGPLSTALARRYGLEIADALAHAHEQGVTHRDLKSTNVIITPKRGAKVLDFGLARLLDTHRLDALSQSQQSLTAEGILAGTLSYMPPELLRGQRGDQRADIWALGILLYEMVSGQRPFTGVTGFELSAAILHQPPAELPPGVPAPLRTIVQRCLEKDPSDRYQQAADLHRALDEMDAGAGVTGLRAGVTAWGPPSGGPRWLRMPAAPLRRVLVLLLLAIGLAIAGIVSDDTRSGEFSTTRGYSLLQDGQVEEAIAEFEAVTEQESTDANAWDSLGEGYLASGAPDKALEAYAQALTLNANYGPSIRGRGLSLAALGRYDEAFEKPSPDFAVSALLLSRVGRYREAAAVLAETQREATDDSDADTMATARLLRAWLLIEQQGYPRALEEIRAAESAVGAGDSTHPLLVLASLMAGIAEIRAGNISTALSLQATQKSRAGGDERLEAKWLAALDGEVALAQGQYDRARASFAAANTPIWMVLGRDPSAIFAANQPSRDGIARVEIARGNRAAAIEEYRHLTTGPGKPLSPFLEPRHVLALARLLDQQRDAAGARSEYARFLTLWTNADADLPELAEARAALTRLSVR